MKKLSKIAVPPAYIDWHKDIVSSKNEPRKTNLKSLHASVERRFNEFEVAIAADSLSAITENASLQRHRVDLQSCYGSKTKKLSEMLQSIRDEQSPGLLKWCPYCGLTGPGSHDHYLPKELFPEFSVNPHNLVSACTKCNSTKGSRWVSGGERLFIHFYSDPVPEELFLLVELHHKNGAFSASYKIRRPATTDPAVWSLIENHFRELNLLGKYRENTNYEIVSALNQCVAHLEDGGSGISTFLKSLAKGEAEIFGENHWRIVLMRSLAHNSDFAIAVESKL